MVNLSSRLCKPLRNWNPHQNSGLGNVIVYRYMTPEYTIQVSTHDNDLVAFMWNSLRNVEEHEIFIGKYSRINYHTDWVGIILKVRFHKIKKSLIDILGLYLFRGSRKYD